MFVFGECGGSFYYSLDCACGSKFLDDSISSSVVFERASLNSSGHPGVASSRRNCHMSRVRIKCALWLFTASLAG
jgi:hypothetical protein